jgi:large subunit ribosomal protein L17
MRHRMKNKRVGRPTDQRIALLRNQVTQLFLHGKIETTEARARATKRLAEKTITIARQGDLAAKKRVRIIVNNREAYKRLFDEIAPSYKDRKGGYLRMLKLPPRHGDAAPMAVLVLVEE